MAEGVKAGEDVLTDAPVEAPAAPGPGGVEEMVDRLEAERDEALKQLRIARSLAWSYEHRMFSYREIGLELTAEGDPIEPSWLTSPAAPFETVHHANLADFTGNYGTVYGAQTTGLKVGDAIWVTDKHEVPGDADPAYAQVRQVGDGYVRVQVLCGPTDVELPADRTAGEGQ